MKKILKFEVAIVLLLLLFLSAISCVEKSKASYKEMAINDAPIITKAIKTKKTAFRRF